MKCFCLSLCMILGFFSNKLCADSIINGSGATFPSPLYTKWFAEYNKLFPDVKINYQSIGSGGGIRLLIEEKIDFAASDIPMNDKQIKNAKNTILHIPTAMGAVVVTYNLPSIGEGLRLDADTLSDIFLGSIQRWNHERLKDLNPDLSLPDMKIQVIHRADASGTTAIFTSYLAKSHTEWVNKTGPAINWPHKGLGGKGNDGVAGLIKQTPGSLGYVELIYAKRNHLSFAFLKNKSGQFVKPTTQSVTAALHKIDVPENLIISAIDGEDKDAYPICGLTYMLVFENMLGIKGKMFKGFLNWAISDGQKYIEDLSYAPLPDFILKKVGEKINSIKFEAPLSKQ